MLLKRAAIFPLLLLAGLSISCGSSNSGSSTQTSGIKDRALIDNSVTGLVNILNIDTNPVTQAPSPVAALNNPKQMLVSSDKAFVLIYDDSAFSISILNTTSEQVGGSVAVNYHTDSIVLASNNKRAYAAVPNVPEQNTPYGAVLSYDLTTSTPGAQVAVPGARRLAISPDAKSLLVFADNDNNVYFIDLTATSLKAVTIPGFNNPYSAVFSSDSSTAYVLNCGTECSGTAVPSVQKLTVSPTAQTVGASVPVPGATVGLLDGSNLYVAGNDTTQAVGSQGVFTNVNVTNMTAGAPVAIADGLHNKMVEYGGKLWIGSWHCSTNKCLSIVPTSGGTATIGATNGDVTAITPAPAKNWVYIMQGGELYQYDPSSLSEFSPWDVVGQGWDIKLLDQ